MTALNFSAPVVGSNISLNGNATANRVLVTGYIDVVLNNNEYIFIRFFDVNSTGPDAGMAIDDLTVAWETAATGDETYLWNVAGSGAYSTSSSWSPNRTLPSATDRLIFSQGLGTTLGPFNVVNETVSQVIVDNSTSVTMNPGFGTNVLTATDQFIIGTGSTLSINTLNLAMTSATNSFSGGGNLTLFGTPTVSFHAAAPAFPTGTVTIAATSTINYAGDRDQTVIPRTDYGNVRFSGATVTRTKTLGAGNLTAAGAVQVQANNVFNLGGSARVLTLTSADSSFSGVGTLDLSGAAHTVNIADATPSLPTTFTPGTSSTVVLNRNGNQTVPARTYAFLSGTTGGVKQLIGSTTVTRGINLGRRFNLNGHTLTIGDASFVAADVANSVTGVQFCFNGTIARFFNTITGAANEFVFPFADSATGKNRRVEISFNTANAAGTVGNVRALDYQALSGHPGVLASQFPISVPPSDPAFVDGVGGSTADEVRTQLQVSNLDWLITCPSCTVPSDYDLDLFAFGLSDGVAPIDPVAAANLRVLKRPNFSSPFAVAVGFAGTTFSSSGDYILEHNSITDGFSSFSIGVIGETTILPVTWTAVSARRQAEGGAEVTWTVASELNNERFEVQRASNAQFTSATTLATLPGRGTSDQAMTYRYTDADAPRAGRSYYRIRQVDFDGRSSLSPVAALDAVADWAVYPNPLTGPLSVVGVGVDAQAPVALQLIGTDGRVLIEATVPSQALAARIEAGLATAPAGLYLLRVGGRSLRLVKP